MNVYKIMTTELHNINTNNNTATNTTHNSTAPLQPQIATTNNSTTPIATTNNNAVTTTTTTTTTDFQNVRLLYPIYYNPATTTQPIQPTQQQQPHTIQPHNNNITLIAPPTPTCNNIFAPTNNALQHLDAINFCIYNR